jgi:hypothetical protein
VAPWDWRRKRGRCEPRPRPTGTPEFHGWGKHFYRGREHTDPFTLQYTAGHDNIKTVRYAHPPANAVHTLFARLAALRSGKLCPTVRCKR